MATTETGRRPRVTTHPGHATRGPVRRPAMTAAEFLRHFRAAHAKRPFAVLERGAIRDDLGREPVEAVARLLKWAGPRSVQGRPTRHYGSACRWLGIRDEEPGDLANLLAVAAECELDIAVRNGTEWAVAANRLRAELLAVVAAGEVARV